MKRFLKYTKIVLINLIILVVILALIDPFFALPEDGWENARRREIDLREYPPNFDQNVAPTQAYLDRIGETGPVPSRLRTESHGFIVGGDPQDYEDKCPDVIVFGGSTTECLYNPEKHRYPHVAQQQLSEMLGREVIVLNGGYSGSHVIHSSMSLLAKGVPLKPEWVVLLNNINDLSQLTKTGSYWVAPQSRDIIQWEESASEGYWTQRLKAVKNFLFPNLWDRLSRLRAAGSSKEKDEWEGYRDSSEHSFSGARDAFHEALNDFVEIAENHGIKVLLCTQFNRLNEEDKQIKKIFGGTDGQFRALMAEHAVFNQDIRNFASQKRIAVLDLDSLVPKTAEYMYDEVHLTEKGAIFVGELLAKQMAHQLD